MDQIFLAQLIRRKLQVRPGMAVTKILNITIVIILSSC